jgi:nicotinate-nucleotide adenylyltransferase
MKREAHSDQGGDEYQSAPTRQRKNTECQITRNPNGSYRDAMDHCERAVVHDAAIPVIVDGAGLCASVVVHLERKRRNHNSGEGEDDEKWTHSRTAILSDASRRSQPAIKRPTSDYDGFMTEHMPGPNTGQTTAAQTGRRSAFFGGSFDPPHLGHLAIARAARDAFHLDTVLFAPVGAQPLKPEGSFAGFDDRLAMTRLAIAGEPGFAVSLVDAPKSSGAGDALPNYTIDTLNALRAEFKADCTLYCLMGADSFFGLRQWHRAAEIPYAAALIVASRPGQSLAGLQAALPPRLALEPAPAGDRVESSPSGSGIEVRAFTLVNPAGKRAPFYLLPGLDVEISGTDIRTQIRSSSGGQIANRSLLPAAVRDYIVQHGLYGG